MMEAEEKSPNRWPKDTLCVNTPNPSEPKEEKKVNKTWEAFGKWKGAFTVIDPKFEL